MSEGVTIITSSIPIIRVRAPGWEHQGGSTRVGGDKGVSPIISVTTAHRRSKFMAAVQC